MKALKKPVKIFFIVLIGILVILSVIEILIGIIGTETANEYRYIRSDERYERLKQNVYFFCSECSGEIISKAAAQQLTDAGEYTLHCNERILEAEDIEIKTDGDSRLVMITYCTNEAVPKPTDSLKARYENLIILYQHDKAGALYCNDSEMLREYADFFSHQANGHDRLSLTPIADDLYFFIGTKFYYGSVE